MSKRLAKKGVVGGRIVFVIKEVVPAQVLLTRENSAMMKNIAEATDVSNFSPAFRNICDSMLP